MTDVVTLYLNRQKVKANHALRLSPACFDSTQDYLAWSGFARQAPVQPYARHCEDCTKDYQSEMILAGRCEHPEIYFGRVDGAMVGIHPKDKKKLGIVPV